MLLSAAIRIRPRSGAKLGRPAAFWLLAVTLGLLLFASRLGALLGVAAPLTGLALGALGAGLLVQYGPDPIRLVYWLLLGGFAFAILLGTAIPETVTRDGPWLHSLRPRIAVPASLRVAFVATIPCLMATWALGGLVLSLGPSLTASVLGICSEGEVVRIVVELRRRSQIDVQTVAGSAIS